MRRFLPIFLFALASAAVSAASVEIKGIAPQYASQELTLYTITDGITYHRRVLAKDTLAADGSFSFRFDSDETLYCKMDLGYYTGCIFAAPGSTYSVSLPPRRDLSKQEKINPYFRPEELLLSINNPAENDINLLVEDFEDKLDSIWNKLIFEDGTPEDLNLAYNELETRYSKSEDAFFDDYRKYSFAQLLDFFGRRGRDIAISQFMLPDAPAYNNPAYWQAIEMLLPRFEHRSFLLSNPRLYDLVLLQDVNNGNLQLSYLDSVSTAEALEIAGRIKADKNKTEKGKKAEISRFVSVSGDTLRWKSFAEPYVYLCFANSGIRESMADLAFVSKLKAKWRRNFNFVFVFLDEDRTKCVGLAQNMPQNVYICCEEDNSGIKEAFCVKAAPEYFILTNQGIFDKSPAPRPAYFEL